MYMRTLLAGNLKNNLFDAESFLEYTLRYSKERFSLGDLGNANALNLSQVRLMRVGLDYCVEQKNKKKKGAADK